MLGFSPDWDARYCYLIVLACGIVSARIQVQGRLDVLKSKAIYAWCLRTTWLVFTTYLVIPLILFWLLDRTGALQDTSLFAAILVGLAYPAVLAGGTSLKPAQGVAGVVGWLNKAADSLVTKTTAYVAVEDRLFMRNVVEAMLLDPARQTAVERLAKSYADVPASVINGELASQPDPAAKAQVAYDYATNSAYGIKPLGQIVKSWKLKGVHCPHARAWRSCTVYASVLGAISVVVAGLLFAGPGDDVFRVWRIVKPGVSAADLHRNREILKQRLGVTGACAERMRGRLAAALIRPGLELGRTDEILRLLLLPRGKCGEPRFAATFELLIDALRAGSVDVRARVHHALLLLVEECGPASADVAQEARLKELQAWKPLATESPIDLERKWRTWHTWWGKASAPN
jgi:hypothetical protein